MGFFGKAGQLAATEKEITWKQNRVAIEGDYLVTSGVTSTVRIPVASIETAVWSMNPMKPTIAPNLRIIGCGTILAEFAVGLDLIKEVQDWIMENVANKNT